MHLTLATFVLVLCRVVLGTPELIQFLGLFLQNGTWYFVEVQAQARLEHTPDPVMYVNIHDSTVLACTVSIFTIDGKIRAIFEFSLVLGGWKSHSGNYLVQGQVSRQRELSSGCYQLQHGTANITHP